MVAVFASQASFALPSARLCHYPRGLDMEPAREPPWTEHEKVYLLAEILKGSQISSQALYSILRENDVLPNWTEIALPQGRSLRSCQVAFNQILTERPAQPTPISHPVQELPRKRPHPPDFPSVAGGRPLQPRPPLLYGHEPIPSPYGIGAMGEPAQKKKRGRPTKAEAEARAVLAAARGEVYPPPSRKKPSSSISRPSLTGSEGTPGTPIAGPVSAGPTEIVTTPQHSQMEVVEETSSSKRRRGKPTPLELGEGVREHSIQLPESPLQSGPTRPDSGRAIYLHPTPSSDEPGSATERRDIRMEGAEDYPGQAPQNLHHQHQQPPQNLPPTIHPPPPHSHPQQQPSTSRSFKETVGM